MFHAAATTTLTTTAATLLVPVEKDLFFKQVGSKDWDTAQIGQQRSRSQY